jgi:hypothetical protein
VRRRSRSRSATTGQPRASRSPTPTSCCRTLNPEHLLGGRMAIRRELAIAAVQGLADRLGSG